MDAIFQWFLGLLGTVITMLVSGVLIPMLVKYLKAKTNNENIQMVIADMGTAVSDSVGFITQTVVEQYKVDGSWDARSQKDALNMAVDMAISNLSQKTKDIIRHDKLDLKRILTAKIEAEILHRKYYIKEEEPYYRKY